MASTSTRPFIPTFKQCQVGYLTLSLDPEVTPGALLEAIGDTLDSFGEERAIQVLTSALECELKNVDIPLNPRTYRALEGLIRTFVR